MFKSHITQEMQNYFDYTDVRSRENSYALEGQLLNLAAMELENLLLRINRESSLTLQTVPISIDNNGVYYAGRVPDAFILSADQTVLNSVTGTLAGIDTALQPYDDTLPVPATIEIESSIASVAMSDPIMFTVIGGGDDLLQSYPVLYANPGTLPIPNQLTMWLDQLGLNQVAVTITITGETFPQPAWVAEQKKTTETITITAEGSAITRNRWVIIDKIAVRNLPVGVRLRGWSMPFNLPACPDLPRPYTDPAYRDKLFPRYWVISNADNRLEEDFLAVGFTGLEMLTLRPLTDTLADVAIEPNTNGLFAISQSSLYYLDRREALPSLVGTGILVEPLYGLQVTLDPTVAGSTSYVNIAGVPYANSLNVFQYRYTVMDPSNLQWCVLPDGSLIAISDDAGWRAGAPQSVSLPLLITGSYTFTLDCQDINGVVSSDVVPFQSQAFAPLVVIDISTTFDNVQGMAFDSYGRLWVWTGTFAIPIKIHYNGYVFDAAGKTIYTTDSFDTLTIF